MSNITINKELDKITASSEIRTIPDRIDKAVKIMFDYCGDEKIKKSDLEKYFNIDNKTLQRRVWSTLLGYTDHDKSKPRYLAPVWEEHLSENIDFFKKNSET